MAKLSEITPKISEQVSSLFVFSTLSPAIVDRIAAGSVVINFGVGEMFCRQGDPADMFPIVLSGKMKLFRESTNGKEVVVRVIEDGDALHLNPSMQTWGTFTESAEAVMKTTVLCIKKTHLNECVGESPGINDALSAYLFSQTQSLIDEIAQLKGYLVRQRAAAYLLSLCKETAGQEVVLLPYQKTLLAAQIGASRESLSRAFFALRKVGVEVKNKTVIVEDVMRLRRYADVAH